MNRPAPPGVAVSVLAFHSIATIERCVRSVAAQDHSGPIALHVREQGGDDDELALIRELAATLSSPDCTIHVTSGPNLGFAGGHNLVARTATQPYVVFLNADAWLEPRFVSEALLGFTHPDIAAVQGKVLRAGDTTIDSTGLELAASRRACGRRQGEPADGPEPAGEPFGPDGAAFVMRRVAIDDVALPGDAGPQLFAESFFAYKEDVDLAYRLRWAGWRTAYAPDARAWHERSMRERPSAGTLASLDDRWAMDDDRYALGFANTRLLLVRNEPLATLVRDAPQIAPREVAAWGLVLARPRVAAAAVRHLVRGVPSAVRARRAILGGRRTATLAPFITRPDGGTRRP